MQSFSEITLSTQIAKAIADLGYEKPSPIQALALPILLGDRTDFIGLAATGTGKTAAFGIPLLEKIETDARGVQALILCPTRELALQVAGQINLIGRYKRVRSVAVYGGSSYADQIRGLRDGAQVVVGTPGRVVDHIERGTLRLDNLKTIILDEADEMISMGFKEELEKVLAAVPRDESNIWLFSATMSREVRKVADVYLRTPKQVQVNREEMLSSTVEQYYYPTQENNKAELLVKLIEGADDFYGLVFCQTKALVVDLTQFLADRGYKVDSLHGDKDQNARERTMTAFRNRRVNILVCTDVASRGLDVKDITHVVNYSLPRELENYVHRIGRTARSGKTGIAMNLVTLSHRRLIYAIENHTKSKMLEGRIPTRREIGARKVAKRLETFNAQAFHQRAIEVMSEEFKTTLAAMSPEEVAGRFLTMMMPDVFNDGSVAPAKSASVSKVSISSRPAGPAGAVVPPYTKSFLEPKAASAPTSSAPAARGPKPTATFASDEPGSAPARISRASSPAPVSAPKAPVAEAAKPSSTPLAEAVALLKAKSAPKAAKKAPAKAADDDLDLDLDFDLDAEEEQELNALLGSLESVDAPVVFEVPEDVEVAVVEKPKKSAKAKAPTKKELAAQAALDALEAQDELGDMDDELLDGEEVIEEVEVEFDGGDVDSEQEAELLAQAPKKKTSAKLPALPKEAYTRKAAQSPILTDSKASPFAKTVASPYASKRKFESDRPAPRRAAYGEGGPSSRPSFGGPRRSDDSGAFPKPGTRRPGDRAPRASFGAGPNAAPRPSADRGPSYGGPSRGPRAFDQSGPRAFGQSGSRDFGAPRLPRESEERGPRSKPSFGGAASGPSRGPRTSSRDGFRSEPRATVGDVTRELMNRSKSPAPAKSKAASFDSGDSAGGPNRRARRAMKFAVPGAEAGSKSDSRD